MPRVKKEETTKKVVTKKETVKVEVKVDSKVKSAEPKTKVQKSTAKGGLSVPVYSIAGAATGTLDLPKEVFGVPVNDQLIAQAMRIYLNNQKGHFGNTKTRGEVDGSTRKIYKQKGTGNARHGGKRAPIFVGGGIAFGPKQRKVVLSMPKKMKRAALISALSAKALDNQVVGVTGLDKSSGKTKEMVKLMGILGKFQIPNSKFQSTLFIVDGSSEMAFRGIKNLKGIDMLPVNQLNAYSVISHQALVVTADVVKKLAEVQND